MQRTASGRARRAAAAVAAVALLVSVAVAVGHVTLRYYLGEGRVRAEATLELTASALGGWLRRYEIVPRLLGDDDRLRQLVSYSEGGDIEQRTQMANRWLADRNAILGSSEIYVIAPDGTTLAASNFDKPDSFVGRNFAYRPYFVEAMQGRTGRFFGIGTTSGVRGYYFAGPIRDHAGRIAGVLAVKVGLDELEAEWAKGVEEVLVIDPEGIVFLSSERDWLYSAFEPLTPQQTARSQASRRYAEVRPHEIEAGRSTVGGVGILTIRDENDRGSEHVEVRRSMPAAEWTLHVLLDTAPLRAQARMATGLLIALLGALGLGALILSQRRQREGERLALREAAKIELERRVEERTAELEQANRLIAAEVAERRLAEAELRRTQADLVQAGKLAALGRISAALSHEINQPLAAVRNYADSAAILIERGEPERAKGNVVQILSLVDRMAAIARHLREVARKPQSPLRAVDLNDAVAEALVIVGPRLTAAGVEVTVDLLAGVSPARAGPVRLQQVIVNLLANAADAVEGQADRRVRISAFEEGARLCLTVSDSGPGVQPALAEQIFDPFFTTKGVGAGLGLGLSISYNIAKDFGGDLSVAAGSLGGAAFTLSLYPAAVPAGMAAE
ncbi:sensor histidine kinase [Rubellimicrobium rubrum]|uniref:sensor histidine kinase n=1 Tax=Rubellimicrobium rubrum TaxID=2585369 RepID=UPI00159B8F31|nr:ATP-binding protein [Rubellimicrobium rubrum]